FHFEKVKKFTPNIATFIKNHQQKNNKMSKL
ncbi:unnamed protein product, partial [marine sediment metagenome]